MTIPFICGHMKSCQSEDNDMNFDDYTRIIKIEIKTLVNLFFQKRLNMISMVSTRG